MVDFSFFWRPTCITVDDKAGDEYRNAMMTSTCPVHTTVTSGQVHNCGTRAYFSIRSVSQVKSPRSFLRLRRTLVSCPTLTCGKGR